MPPKVPALPTETIQRIFDTMGVPVQDIRALLRSDGWRTLESRNQQVAFSRDFVKNESQQTVISNVIDHAFGIEASQVRKICSKADKKPKSPYRPAALHEDQTVGMLAFFRNRYGAHNFVTQKNIHSFIESNYRKYPTYQ
jgi:predicted dithiol-disulfide oxidoreductase (DUF899 family)